MTNKIGVVPAIDRFDTAYFGIHRQQATFMDPMQRLILERAFEALIDAGKGGLPQITFQAKEKIRLIQV